MADKVNTMDQFENMKSLAMWKMEKNFIAHVDKRYPRRPYEAFTTYRLLERLNEELLELMEACLTLEDVEKAKSECADVSNIVDYIYERLANGKIRP